MNERSIWSQTMELPPRGRLEKELRADVAVIGAGMAGVMTAYLLQKRGLRTVVLEARQTGSGQTGRTTAKLTSQHGMLYDGLIQKFGQEKAAQYAQANQQAVRALCQLIREEQIECGLQPCPACLYSTTSKGPLEREAEAARSLGLPARFTTETELPFPVSGAVWMEEQARFHPLKLLAALAGELEIYENSPVLDVQEHAACTERGAVHADKLVFATHYPFINVPGWYFCRMHQERSYVLALRGAWLPKAAYYGVDNGGLSFREGEGLLLVGGGNHRTGENSGGGRYRELLARCQGLFPGCEAAARWSAQDCVTLDGVPYIGRFSASTPDWYIATGFGKWGMSASMAAALLISGQLTGETPDWAEVFSPSRFQLSAAAKNLGVESMQALKGIGRQLFSPPRALLDALPAGHGGIVEAEGRKVGVYKDDSGQCHLVSVRCPHLGCQLEWNPDEKSWDCPCHGSRFDFHGALLDGPAQEGLEALT